MKNERIEITKSTGEKVRFSLKKLETSLKRTGADKQTVNQIIDKVRDELYQGISTKEIYNRAFALLKKEKGSLASKYKLKKAIYELGPTGFPFERFVGDVFKYSGFNVSIGAVLSGKCVRHEVDIVAQKAKEIRLIECKFHGEQGIKCNVKIPLYIHSRFEDIKSNRNSHPKNDEMFTQGWVVTNTRFTADAIQYSECCGLHLLSWDFPKNNALKDRIDRLGLYPITVSTLLSKREKQFLLGRNIVLCRALIHDKFYLDHLGISELRKERILKEISGLCKV